MFETEVTNYSAEQMISKITHLMNVNIMPNILATWKGIFQKLSFILGMTWEGLSKMFETELTNDSANKW